MSDVGRTRLSWPEICKLMVGKTILAVEPGQTDMTPTVILFHTGERLVLEWAGGWELYGIEWETPGEFDGR